jgi:hypothetical protein
VDAVRRAASEEEMTWIERRAKPVAVAILELRQFGVVQVGGKVSMLKDSSMLVSVINCLSLLRTCWQLIVI